MFWRHWLFSDLPPQWVRWGLSRPAHWLQLERAGGHNHNRLWLIRWEKKQNGFSSVKLTTKPPSHKSCSGAVTPLSLIRLRLWDAVVIICTALSDQFSAKHKKCSRSPSLMDTDGETVALMLLEGQSTQTLHRYLSCCAMTLNHFWGESLQACIIIFLRAGFHQSFRNWAN